MSANILFENGDGMDGYIDPALLTRHRAVSTPDSVESGEWTFIGAGGSARSPSIVNLPSTSSGFSSYAGSPAGGPSDVDFTLPGTEQDSMAAPQNPTGLVDAPGDTMHDMAATRHHGVIKVTPVTWNMESPISANDMALQNAFLETLDQMQFNMAQDQDLTSNITHAVPNNPATMIHSNENPSPDS